jgi:hypothetical protein
MGFEAMKIPIFYKNQNFFAKICWKVEEKKSILENSKIKVPTMDRGGTFEVKIASN